MSDNERLIGQLEHNCEPSTPDKGNYPNRIPCGKCERCRAVEALRQWESEKKWNRVNR